MHGYDVKSIAFSLDFRIISFLLIHVKDSTIFLTYLGKDLAINGVRYPSFEVPPKVEV